LPVPFYPVFSALFRSSCFNKVDVLHVPYPKFPYFRKPDVPIVVTVNDIIPFLFPKYHNWKRNVYFSRFLPWYFKKVDAIIALSNHTKLDLLNYYGVPEEKISVVHAALPSIEYVKTKKEPYVLYVSTLEPRKNVEGIIRAFVLLKSRGFDKKLIIAGGKGWNYAGVFRLIQKLNLTDSVKYLGYVSEEEKTELYRKAEVFVYPSFYEGFGLPVLEAMAYGTPVVTSNVSSLPEVAGDAAVLVDPHSPKAIADGILEAISNSSNLVRKGLKRSKFFSLESMTEKVLKVYEGVLK